MTDAPRPPSEPAQIRELRLARATQDYLRGEITEQALIEAERRYGVDWKAIATGVAAKRRNGFFDIDYIGEWE